MKQDKKKKSKLQPNSTLRAALKYAKLGLSIIPLKKSGDQKKPYVKWKYWQKKRPSRNKITEWWEKWPDANIGVVTGKVSGKVVLDFNSEEARNEFKEEFGLPKTSISKTDRGYHFFYGLPKGITLPNLDLTEETRTQLLRVQPPMISVFLP